MSENQSIEEKYGLLFRELAEMVNQQPKETREQTRRLIGEFLHDIKHTLGLITGANAVILRKLEGNPELTQSAEMIKISDDASSKIDAYVNIVTENLTTQIDADVIE